MSPFGTGIPGALDALKKPVPPTNVVNDRELERYLGIVLEALQNKLQTVTYRQRKAKLALTRIWPT